MGLSSDIRNSLGLYVLFGLAIPCFAQISNFLPEIDAYWRTSQSTRLWFQAKETFEAGAPVTAEIGPSFDFYFKSLPLLSDITLFQNDESKSHPAVFTIGYRYLPYPDAPPTNRLEPVLTINVPLRHVKVLLSDRNRFDLDWNSGTYQWHYRNRIQLQRTWNIHSYHLSPYV